MDRATIRQMRGAPAQFRAEDAGNAKTIEGYFAVFGENYELWPGATESVAPEAFDGALAGDVRALIDHQTNLVLGRTKAGTLELRTDSHGLWGKVTINENDTDAMNLYERVKRGDVDQCSFGFDIESEDTEYRDDGTVHWTIRKVRLYEVSVCTFPAYESTSVSARRRDYATIQARDTQAWKEKQIRRLKPNA